MPYRNPAQLPPGGVLVAGSGQSGVQIADDLIRAGRRVFLSAGSCGWVPRRYRGRDIACWLVEMGLLERSDWQAKWIGSPIVGGPYSIPPAPLLSKRFSVDKPIASAELDVDGGRHMVCSKRTSLKLGAEAGAT